MCEDENIYIAVLDEYRNLVRNLFSDVLRLLDQLGSDNKELKKKLEQYRQKEQIDNMNNLT